MKTQLLNANAIEIKDIDLKNITPDDANEIARLYFTHLVVVIRNQDLTAQDLIDVAYKFGEPEFFDEKTYLERAAEGVNGVQRVCKGFNNDGSHKGLFAHDDELDWHANRPSAETDRKPIIFLYAHSNTAGSRISWANMALAYEDLEDDIKDWLSDKKGIYGFEPNSYTKNFNIWRRHRNENGQECVRTNDLGVRGLFFPYHQFFGFKDVAEQESKQMTEYLRNHCYQEKYFYHHDYRDGDVIFGDQWLTVHKRWACELGDRMLYRVSMDWSNIIL